MHDSRIHFRLHESLGDKKEESRPLSRRLCPSVLLLFASSSLTVPGSCSVGKQ